MSDALIETRHLSFSYYTEEDESGVETAPAPGPNRFGEKVFAVKDISVRIGRGENIAVIGRNGSGKSTFAKLLNLVLEPTDGELYIDGKQITADITDEEVLELRRRVEMVFQNPDNQLVANIVEEDVAFGPENLGVPSEEIRRRVDEAMAVTGITDFAHSDPSRLSGGQKQRVAIAGIIAMMPECMIFDESTAMLDPIGRAEVLAVMDKLVREHGLTVINITHLMNEAAAADRIIVINKGRLIGDGTPEVIFSNKELIAEAGLELPQCAALIRELRKRGADIPGELVGITPDECAGLILDSINRKQHNP